MRMATIRQASIWHGKDGYSLHIADVPAWVLAAEWADGVICIVSCGYLCAVCLPARWSWLFKIGYGRDEDGLREHSIGGFVFHLGQEIGRFLWSRHVQVYEQPLTFGTVCEHFPDSRVEWDDDGVNYVRGVMQPHRDRGGAAR